ncbi:hypothetical protein HHI36_021761 [Cryptolaemus montrouzieri]|uniref:SAP domain-containing protein n=1 Tax=Cryptolaemus montrouzieri TaxID=559131 RepID=A0ABD2MY28_9CUCU
MAGKKNRSQNSLNSIPVTSLNNPPSKSVQKSHARNKKTTDELLNMSKEQLKSECRKRGQKTTGNKNELLQRLGYKMQGTVKRKDVTEITTTNGNSQLNKMKNDNSLEQQRKQQDREERKVFYYGKGR